MIIGPTPHKGEVFGGLGLAWQIRTLFRYAIFPGRCISTTVPFLSTPGALAMTPKGADGATDLLEVLRNSPLEKLDFTRCSQIPSAAWQKLRGASWTNLREANFSWCLVLQTWLRCLAGSDRRGVFFSNVKGHCHGLGLRWHKRTFFGVPSSHGGWYIPTVPFWALQVLLQWHRRCRWGRGCAGSLAQLSLGEVGLWSLLSNSVRCVAASFQWRMACAAWCTRHPRGRVVKDCFWRRSRRKFLSWEVGFCIRFWGQVSHG